MVVGRQNLDEKEIGKDSTIKELALIYKPRIIKK